MKTFAYILILIPIILVTFRVATNEEPDPGVISELTYNVTYQYDVRGGNQYYEVESYLPLEDIRQAINLNSDDLLNSDISLSDQNINRKIVWQGSAVSDTTISFQYSATTRHVEYNIDQRLALSEVEISDYSRYLIPSANIQSDHQNISEVSRRFMPDNPVRVRDIVQKLFKYVEEIPSVENSTASNALACLKRRVCSELGKSRLLAALFRSSGIPARVAGGLILTDKKKGNIDYWTQAFIGEVWVTFDTERDHFAELPATHLELFRGDIGFENIAKSGITDSFYDIKRDRLNDYPTYALFNIWNLVDGNELPLRPVIVLLLLPLGAYIVAICTNVVGFKTYGVFLPVLIAFSFIDMGMIQGLVFFSLIIALISLMSYPLERWGILHVPKIVCLLTAVSIYCLAAVKIFYITGWVAPSATLTFPIIILTLISERFAQKVEEESLRDALFIYGQTLIVTLSCYWILSASVIQHFFITFPETLMAIAGLSLLLGEWIGLQLFEYTRFSKINEEVSYVK